MMAQTTAFRAETSTITAHRHEARDLYTLNPIQRERALTRLMNRGEAAIPVLASVLLNRSGAETHVFATAIGAQERVQRAREAAALGLEQFGRAGVNPLMTALCSGDAEARELAARALHNIGDPAVVPLTRALQSLDVEVRTHAAAALAGLNAEKSAQSLRKLLYDEIETRQHLRRRWVAQTGKEMAVRFAVAIAGGLLLRESAFGIVVQWAAFCGMGIGFADTGATLRRNTITALSATDDPRLVGAFALCLDDRDREIRRAASDALKMLLPRVRESDGNQIAPNEMEALLRTLDSEDAELVKATLKALEQIGDARALPHVLVIADAWERADIARAARECLPFLRQRQQQARQAQTLLRPSSVESDGGKTLLRPAATDTVSPPEQLLRAVS